MPQKIETDRVIECAIAKLEGRKLFHLEKARAIEAAIAAINKIGKDQELGLALAVLMEATQDLSPGSTEVAPENNEAYAERARYNPAVGQGHSNQVLTAHAQKRESDVIAIEEQEKRATKRNKQALINEKNLNPLFEQYRSKVKEEIEAESKSTVATAIKQKTKSDLVANTKRRSPKKTKTAAPVQSKDGEYVAQRITTILTVAEKGKTLEQFEAEVHSKKTQRSWTKSLQAKMYKLIKEKLDQGVTEGRWELENNKYYSLS